MNRNDSSRSRSSGIGGDDDIVEPKDGGAVAAAKEGIRDGEEAGDIDDASTFDSMAHSSRKARQRSSQKRFRSRSKPRRDMVYHQQSNQPQDNEEDEEGEENKVGEGDEGDKGSDGDEGDEEEEEEEETERGAASLASTLPRSLPQPTISRHRPPNSTPTPSHSPSSSQESWNSHPYIQPRPQIRRLCNDPSLSHSLCSSDKHYPQPDQPQSYPPSPSHPQSNSQHQSNPPSASQSSSTQNTNPDPNNNYYIAKRGTMSERGYCALLDLMNDSLLIGESSTYSDRDRFFSAFSDESTFVFRRPTKGGHDIVTERYDTKEEVWNEMWFPFLSFQFHITTPISILCQPQPNPNFDPTQQQTDIDIPVAMVYSSPIAMQGFSGRHLDTGAALLRPPPATVPTTRSTEMGTKNISRNCLGGSRSNSNLPMEMGRREEEEGVSVSVGDRDFTTDGEFRLPPASASVNDTGVEDGDVGGNAGKNEKGHNEDGNRDETNPDQSRSQSQSQDPQPSQPSPYTTTLQRPQPLVLQQQQQQFDSFGRSKSLKVHPTLPSPRQSNTPTPNPDRSKTLAPSPFTPLSQPRNMSTPTGRQATTGSPLSRVATPALPLAPTSSGMGMGPDVRRSMTINPTTMTRGGTGMMTMGGNDVRPSDKTGNPNTQEGYEVKTNLTCWSNGLDPNGVPLVGVGQLIDRIVLRPFPSSGISSLPNSHSLPTGRKREDTPLRPPVMTDTPIRTESATPAMEGTGGGMDLSGENGVGGNGQDGAKNNSDAPFYDNFLFENQNQNQNMMTPAGYPIIVSRTFVIEKDIKPACMKCYKRPGTEQEIDENGEEDMGRNGDLEVGNGRNWKSSISFNRFSTTLVSRSKGKPNLNFKKLPFFLSRLNPASKISPNSEIQETFQNYLISVLGAYHLRRLKALVTPLITVSALAASIQNIGLKHNASLTLAIIGIVSAALAAIATFSDLVVEYLEGRNRYKILEQRKTMSIEGYRKAKAERQSRLESLAQT